MASNVLYAPIVDSCSPAFIAGDNSKCVIYFSLSKFNARADFKYVHAVVFKQSTGLSVVKNTDSSSNGLHRYRSTGVILNMEPILVDQNTNLYCVEIYNSDIGSEKDKYNGWIPGWIYKIQLRLSAVGYDGSIGQASWLNQNGNNFSEWSTVCVTKAIGPIQIKIPCLDFDSDKGLSETEENFFPLSTFTVSGSYTNADISEPLYSYELKLTDDLGQVVEESGVQYTNQYFDPNQFNFTFKKELTNEKEYILEFSYTTLNLYTKKIKIPFTASYRITDKINCEIVTADYDSHNLFSDLTHNHVIEEVDEDGNVVYVPAPKYEIIEEEQRNGRVGLRLYSTSKDNYSGNICIRRTDSRSNFTEWVDIKILVLREESINDYPIIYDYTIESGVWYRYGVQSIDRHGERGVLNQIEPRHSVMRKFEDSFLLGEGGKQLKLEFNNAMASFKVQKNESKTETIGGRYPFITRNGNVNYKTFPLNGLISFWMDDEKNLFATRAQVYDYDYVANFYKDRYENKNINKDYSKHYDTIYEREFRDKVLKFLQDGKPKLFKSPTEGNVVIRITDVNCTPNQQLGRMIYSFAATATEIAEPTMENYREYKFYEVGDWSSEFSTYELHLGQLIMDFPVYTGTNAGAVNTPNVFEIIYNKYDTSDQSLAGYTKTMGKIKYVKIEINDKPLRIANSAGEIVVGNNIQFNGTPITLYGNQRIYEFDGLMEFSPQDRLYFLGDYDDDGSGNRAGEVKTVNATIDFLYEITSDIYVGKTVQTSKSSLITGQIFQNVLYGENLYKTIYYKYYMEWERRFRKLSNVTSICIEGNPGLLFNILDENDEVVETHEIGYTGILNFQDIANIKGITYAGHRDGSKANADVTITYEGYVMQGTYKEEE